MRHFLVALLLLVSTAADAANRVFITEFATLRADPLPFATLPAVVHQPALAISATAVTSAAFKAGTRYVRVVCEVQCSLRVGTGAGLSDMMLPAGRPEYFGVSPGATLSVIANP